MHPTSQCLIAGSACPVSLCHGSTQIKNHSTGGFQENKYHPHHDLSELLQGDLLAVSSLARNGHNAWLRAKSLQSSPTRCGPMDCSLPRLLCQWDFPGKNTGVGCHALLRGSSHPRYRTHVSYISCLGRQVLYHQCHLGSPLLCLIGEIQKGSIGANSRQIQQGQLEPGCEGRVTLGDGSDGPCVALDSGAKALPLMKGLPHLWPVAWHLSLNFLTRNKGLHWSRCGYCFPES